MSREALEKLFEPFFTTKEAGKGTGLGLATVYGIVKQNNGFIQVESADGNGTTFHIYIPRHLEKKDPVPHPSHSAASMRGDETILLVEDEPAILNMTRLMLERFGYRVLSASKPGDALRLAKNHPGEIHLLITDVIMPDLSGQDLAKQLTSIYPGIKRLFTSGYESEVIAAHGVLDEGVLFIQKPFSMPLLMEKVREALAGKKNGSGV